MSSTFPNSSRLLSVATLAAVAIASPAWSITVNASGLAWPTTAEVATSTTITPFGFTDRANSSPFTLTQTFQVGSAFDAESLYFLYGGDASADFSVGLTVFEVADVFAPTITTTPDPADILLDTTFLAPPNPDETIAQLFLDDPLSLPATTGTAGYAVRFTNDDQFRWERSGSSGGNPYAFGAAYENGDAKNAGERDFALAISSEGLPELIDVMAVQSGDLNTASTWSNNAAPSAGFRYLIGSPFAVTANATTFNGGQIVVQSGGSLDFAVSEVVIDGDAVPGLVVEAGGTLTNSTNGDFAIGDITLPTLSRLQLDGTANFSASSGADVFIDVDLSGSGDLNIQSNGVGSDLFLTQAEGHTGVIRFNGTGDRVQMLEEETFSTLEMNSTGANELVYDPTGQLTGGALVFNEPGAIIHAATLGNRRLHGPARLAANAPVTVDLTQLPVTNERRLFLAGDDLGVGLEGSADITVNGTASDPTSGSITRNEFEVGTSGEPSTSDGLNVDTYSGTITGNDFVDLEIRHSLPDASIVVNNNATLEMGHEEIFTELNVAIGDVQVNSGGRLVVGYERDGSHNPYRFIVTDDGTRNGDLTLAAGATTVMQVNGTATEDFDEIVVEGDASIDGTLEILVNPTGFASSFENNNGITINTYAPVLGDTFDLITLGPDSPVGDYDGDGTVGQGDYDLWAADFGSTDSLAADGNGDGVVDAADYTVWRDNQGLTGDTGTLSGVFSSLVVNDPGGVMAGAGLAFQLNYTATAVQLEVIAAGSAAAVPEPGAFTLGLMLVAATIKPRRR